jgi:1-acyl-sn-glycerol-3-phosphate acyltransferase
VVPISIAGSRFVMKKGQLMVCPGHVTVTVHPPMATTGIERTAAREFAEQVRAVVRPDVDEPIRETGGEPLRGQPQSRAI